MSYSVEDGMPKLSRGSYDRDACVGWYLARLRSAVQQRATEDENGQLVSLDDAQIRLTLAKAENEEMTARERRGELMPISLHFSEVSKWAISVRQKFLSLPGRVAAELEGLPRGEIKVALTSQIKSMLSAFAREGQDDSRPATVAASESRRRTRARTPRRTERAKPLARPVPRTLAK